MGLTLKSTQFLPNDPIPERHTCDADDLSPTLVWSGVPEGSRSFALVVDDPDAPGGSFIHWLIWDLAGELRSLPEGRPDDEQLEDLGDARQGRNDFGSIGWRGPCPPPGKPHVYLFRLYALDARLELKPGSGWRDLERAMRGHVLEHAELKGSYQRADI